MSDFVPASCADDTPEFDTGAQIAEGLHIGRSTELFEYLSNAPGAAIDYSDDGADLFLPSDEPGAQGIGKINPDFYKQPRKSKHAREYPVGYEEAVAQDIRKTLRDIKQTTIIHLAPEVLKQQRSEVKAAKKEKAKIIKDVSSNKKVSFVVRGKDGEVVIIDNEGVVINDAEVDQALPLPKRIRDLQAQGTQGSEGSTRSSSSKGSSSLVSSSSSTTTSTVKLGNSYHETQGQNTTGHGVRA